MGKQEYRKQIVQMLKSPERKNWLIAIMTHKQGGFTIDEAWRWLLWGLFCSGGFDNGSNCGATYYNYWCGGDGAFTILDFADIRLKLICESAMDGENSNEDALSYKLEYSDKIFKQDNIAFDCYTIAQYIPDMKPYNQFEGVEGNMQAYFYAIMCFFLKPYKESIIRALHIDKEYIDPERKSYYLNSLFPLT